MRAVGLKGYGGFKRLTPIYIQLKLTVSCLRAIEPYFPTKPHLAALSYRKDLPERIAVPNSHFQKLEPVDDLPIILVQPASQAIVADAPALL